MSVESPIPGRRTPAVGKKESSLEGSFDRAFILFLVGPPVTCPRIGDREFVCGRADVSVPEALSLVMGVNKEEKMAGGVFVAFSFSNAELERRGRILVQAGEKLLVFKLEGASVVQSRVEEVEGEEVPVKDVLNFRSIDLDIYDKDEVRSVRVEPASREYAAFLEILPLVEDIRRRPMASWCDGCAAEKHRLPRPEI
jgi:hypothetical protein